MTIRDASLLLRNPVTQQIDLKQTLQSFARDVLVIKNKENRIRNSRRYKSAVRKVLEFSGTLPTHILILSAIKKMRVKVENWDLIYGEINAHIHFNNGRYLRITPGGVELVKP